MREGEGILHETCRAPHLSPLPNLPFLAPNLHVQLLTNTFISTYNAAAAAAAAAAKSLQSCPTLCDPIDGSPPSSPIPGIL